jgi:hypothetical protein
MDIKEFEVDGLLIPFNPRWQKIAISLSGGADSALLSYILCSKIKTQTAETEVHIISHTRCWKTKPWQQHDSLQIYNYLVKVFPTILFKRHTGFVAPDFEWGEKGPTLIDEYGKQVSGDNIQIRAYAEYVCHENSIDAYYNAVTRNPQNVDFKGLSPRDVEQDVDNQHLRVMHHMNGWAIHPFRFVQKNWVIRQYKKLNIMELFILTRSCEGTFPNIDYKNYEMGQIVPTCGSCFWCKERKWAEDNE